MNTLETHVLELIGESSTSPDVFTDTTSGMAPIRDSLNDAIQEIAMVMGGDHRDYTLPLMADCGFYRLDFQIGEFGWVHGVWYPGRERRLEQTDLIALEALNPRWMQHSGNPDFYFPVGFNHIGLYPTPSAAGEVLELECVAIPGRYTDDTQRIRLRDKVKWAAVHYAVGEYWASRGDAQSAIHHHNEYLKQLGIRAVYPYAAEQMRQFGKWGTDISEK
jgi:hypothetical protein